MNIKDLFLAMLRAGLSEQKLTDKEIEDYLGNKDGYGLHISDLKIYDKPKELSEFAIPCSNARPDPKEHPRNL